METCKLVKILNDNIGCYDESGGMLIISEPDPKQQINGEYEVVINKVTGFTITDNKTYPTTLAVANLVNYYADKYYSYEQLIPSKNWLINHNLNKKPSILITDINGTAVEGEINYIDDNNILLNFNSEFMGFCILN